jgi:hypothetical protein
LQIDLAGGRLPNRGVVFVCPLTIDIGPGENLIHGLGLGSKQNGNYGVANSA